MQDLQTLQKLSSSRHTLPAISSNEVDTLLEVLGQLHQVQAASAERLAGFTNVFTLLARWVHNVQLPAAALSKQVNPSQQQLQKAVQGALELLQSPWMAPNVAAACIMFLGAASKGSTSCNVALIAATCRHDCDGHHISLLFAVLCLLEMLPDVT